MGSRGYITLANSDGSLRKQFRTNRGFGHPREKAQTIRHTVTGALDVTEGAMAWRWLYELRVATEEDDARYGTLADLQTFYGYQNPAGTPSNVLSLTDLEGNAVGVIFTGPLDPQPLVPVIDGPDALYAVRVQFDQAT